VRRPPKSGLDTPQDWEEFEPGAEVIRAGLTRADDGALTVGALGLGLRLAGTDPQWTYLLIGVLMIAAVALDRWIRQAVA